MKSLALVNTYLLLAVVANLVTFASIWLAPNPVWVIALVISCISILVYLKVLQIHMDSKV